MELTINNPAFPDGYAFRVPGLGEVVNGEAREVDEASENSFYQEHGQSLQDAADSNEGWSLSGKGAKAQGPETLVRPGVHVGGNEVLPEAQQEELHSADPGADRPDESDEGSDS